jgi:Zn-dependent peptidase ImmA (M78 family)/DNA-binding XRE family transcriptional regulator
MNRIRQLRLAKGLSLEELALEMGGLVTKQALSKYEKDLSAPSPVVAVRLASALGVKTLHLWSSPAVCIDFIAYRRLSRLGKKKKEQIEAKASRLLEERFGLQERLGLSGSFGWLSGRASCHKVEEAEKTADKIRDEWGLGTDAIADLTSILENRLVHVLEIESEREFDGISACARDENGKIVAAAVTTRKLIFGDRQRMNLAHELGHLALEPKVGMNEEDAAFRFAGAFLLPATTIRYEIGNHRTNLQLSELLALKHRFGVSIQAILHRLCDLEIISATTYKSWMIDIGKKGWRKVEPEPIALEKSSWMELMLTRAVAEGVVTSEEAKAFGGDVGCRIVDSVTSSRAAFLKLPLEERRKILGDQAEQVKKHYAAAIAENDLETGEMDDYESHQS